MGRDLEECIERAYETIQQNIARGMRVDSLEVVKQVEEYRQFWKPEETNVVLLAESHVYTNQEDFEVKLDRFVLHRLLPDYPTRFVRFVYCLGYGEKELLTRRIGRRNYGTPQYWKIFSSSVAESENNLGFNEVLKTRTQSFIRRLHNKVDVLRKMRQKGVWLLDASIVGLYGSGKKTHRMIEKILGICWKNHIADTILEVDPNHIIVVGKGVGSMLRSELQKLVIPFTVIPQPQARGPSEWQLENFKKYQRICQRYS